MSGGFFNYEQYRIQRIADEIEQLILNNNSDELDEYGSPKGCGFSLKTVEEFQTGLVHLKTALIYAQRIDWLVSGDDSEDKFHERLEDDLRQEKLW
jgi:hypothetical protein